MQLGWFYCNQCVKSAVSVAQSQFSQLGERRRIRKASIVGTGADSFPPSWHWWMNSTPFALWDYPTKLLTVTSLTPLSEISVTPSTLLVNNIIGIDLHNLNHQWAQQGPSGHLCSCIDLLQAVSYPSKPREQKEHGVFVKLEKKQHRQLAETKKGKKRRQIVNKEIMLCQGWAADC